MPLNPDNPPWFDLDPNDPWESRQLASIGYYLKDAPGYGTRPPPLPDTPPANDEISDLAQGTKRRADDQPREASGARRPKRRRAPPGPGELKNHKRGRAAQKVLPGTEEYHQHRKDVTKERMKRYKAEEEQGLRPLEGQVCNFCAGTLQGVRACEQQPCNYVWVKNNFQLECQNCADYRSLNPGSGHICRVGQKDFPNRRYGAGDPPQLEQKTCDKCTRWGKENTCEVDTFLGLGCKSCRARRRCTVDEEPMGVVPHITIAPWFRHSCKACAEDDEVKCDWLQDRRTWSQACSQCVDRDRACVSEVGGLFRRGKSAEDGDWKPPLSRVEVETQKLTLYTKYRKTCKNCIAHRGVYDCLVSLQEPYTACLRCTQLGIDCTEDVPGKETNARRALIPGGVVVSDDEDDSEIESSEDNARGSRRKPVKTVPVHYPLLDMSMVGFGDFTTFQVCKNCKDKGRHCDHQRPCDSCIAAGDRCDPWDKANRPSIHGCSPRFIAPPGPLYYLAMGYGPGGVDNHKDCTKLIHNIGPLVPKYAMNEAHENGTKVSAAMISERRMFFPDGIPPCASSKPEGGLLNGVRPSALKGSDLKALLEKADLTMAPNQTIGYEEAFQRMCDPSWPPGWVGVPIRPPAAAQTVYLQPTQVPPRHDPFAQVAQPQPMPESVQLPVAPPPVQTVQPMANPQKVQAQVFESPDFAGFQAPLEDIPPIPGLNEVQYQPDLTQEPVASPEPTPVEHAPAEPHGVQKRARGRAPIVDASVFVPYGLALSGLPADLDFDDEIPGVELQTGESRADWPLVDDENVHGR